jgi:simple sugar transport system ATP-binding protein
MTAGADVLTGTAQMVGAPSARRAASAWPGPAARPTREDLDEVLALSDRIAVMFEGRIMGILPREAASRERIGLMMAGVDPDSEPQEYCPAS